MINYKDSPEKTLNKFLSKEHEGMRGILIARNDEKTKAVMLAVNTAFDGSVSWGKMYLVHEKNPKQYPRFIREVKEIPKKMSIDILEELK